MTMSVQEVADALGITRQRVMQIEKVALSKVRAALLKLDNRQNWEEIIGSIQEKDPFSHLYENNMTL